MQLLNVGCGSRTHNEWINIDKVPANSSVKQCDVEKGLFFSDCSFDVVYHSHVLEHFALNDVPHFLKECCRVLKPGGILRIVVPDLEQIVLCYLQQLQAVSNGNDSARDDYEWIMLEMYDQVVRNSSGGQMATLLNRELIPNRKFIVERCGVEVERLMQHFEERRTSVQQASILPQQASESFAFSLQPKKIWGDFRERILRLLLGDDYKSLKVGRFRCSGENHQWMYDRVSLRLILQDCGFVNIVQREADESYILDWTKFNLDTEPDGTIYKPDSLTMEAVKP